MMPLHFRQERATQAAARLLKHRGGTMSYLKLLKLLYLADRKALLEHGRPITFDRYVSMDHGPVLSQTYNLIVGEQLPFGRPNYWREFITEAVNYEVSLRDPSNVPRSDLSPAQEEILDEVFRKFGKLSRWEIVRVTHTLKEWTDPEGSSVPIDIDEILRAGGMGESDRAAVDEQLAAEEALMQLDSMPQALATA